MSLTSSIEVISVISSAVDVAALLSLAESPLSLFPQEVNAAHAIAADNANAHIFLDFVVLNMVDFPFRLYCGVAIILF
jgi:hypothetical protein